MKPITIIALSISSIAGGVLGTFVYLTISPPQDQFTGTITTGPEKTNEFVVTPTDNGTPLEIASLRSELEELRNEMNSMRSERANAVEPEATPAAAVTTNAPTRDMVLGVLQQEEERKEEERRVEREQREKDALDRRIERIAEKLSLSPADQTTLSQIYTEEREKQSTMWTEMRDGGMDRDMIRESMAEVRDWRTEQLTLSFGEDLAAQIGEESGGRGFDWGGGGRGGNNGGGRGGGGRGN